MKLSLLSIDPGGFIRMTNEGNIISTDFTAEGKNPFEAVIGANWSTHRVLLDLGNTLFIDSAAIGWLIDSHKSFKTAGGRLVVHSLRPKVRQVLDLLKIGRVVALADDESAAKALLQGAGQ
ncbi:MAG: STAS domain-containing protein [Phycisphaerales bacterium]|nr:STAS domain-containing protein [Phycisphaerales bacterium]